MNAKEIIEKLSIYQFGSFHCLPIRRIDFVDGNVIHTEQTVYVLVDDLTCKIHVLTLDEKELIVSYGELFLQIVTWADRVKLNATVHSLARIRDKHEDVSNMVKLHESFETMILFHRILIGLVNPQYYMNLDNKNVDTYEFCLDVLTSIEKF